MNHWIFILARPDGVDIVVLGVMVVTAVALAGGAIAWNWWKNGAVRRRLRRFFGRRYRQLPVVSRPFSILDIPNIRRAVEAFTAANNATLEILTFRALTGTGLQSDQLVHAAPQFRQM